MHIRLPHARRPVVAVFGGALFGAALVGAGPVVPGMWDRPACAETVMKAVSTEQPVAGTYNCFDRSLQTGLVSVGIDSDGAFATRVGQNGEYRYLHKTEDGGYIYEYDRPMLPHDKVRAAISALGWPKTSADLRGGNFAAAWNESHDFASAWAEITGQTQKPRSQLFTFYLDGKGKIESVK